VGRPSPRGSGRVGLWGAVAIGIGGMVGGGIFAVLGLSVQIAGGGAPIAFLVAGLVALGSAGFLIIFAVVNVAEARTASERGSAAWISVVAAVACTAALAALIARSRPGAVFVLAAMVTLSFGIEAIFRKVSGRALKV